MSAKKHVVVLSAPERLELERAARSNKRSLRERQRARILLAAAAARSDAAIAKDIGVHANTVAGVRRRFAGGGGAKTVVRRAVQKRRKARRLDGRAEAHLVALVCSAPPDERKRWSLHLLAGKLIEAQVVDSVSHETVRQTLKKISSSRG
jgi:transposase